MHAVHAAAHVQTMDETVRETAASKNGTLRIWKTLRVSDVDKGYTNRFEEVGNGTLPI